MERTPAVYILASKPNGTLYIGVTSDLIQRVWQHKEDQVEGFTKKHQVHSLVYFEMYASMHEAITREKQLNAGSRKNKVALIVGLNPEWCDLYPDIIGS